MSLQELAEKHRFDSNIYGETFTFTLDQLHALIKEWLEQNKDGRPQLERVIIDEMKESL